MSSGRLGMIAGVYLSAACWATLTQDVSSAQSGKLLFSPVRPPRQLRISIRRPSIHKLPGILCLT